MFNSLRTWCYKWVSEYQGGSLDRWHEAVRGKADKLNTFKAPLPASEIKATAKSVAKWTWSNYTGKMTASSLAEDGLTPETFSLLQSNLGKMAMAKRWGDNSEKKAEAIKMAAGGLSSRKIAAGLAVNQSTVIRWIKG